MQEPVPGIQALPDEKNARYFHVNVSGPADVSCSSYVSLIQLNTRYIALRKSFFTRVR